MRIADVLRRKGDHVVTVPGDLSVLTVLDILAEHGVGALVVSADGCSVDGIVSERDVVRRLQADGPRVLAAPVAQIMTTQVHTCGPGDSVEDLARTMTAQRVRHIPVVLDGAMVGLVSIGDVVKSRIDELTAERDQLTSYISS